MIQKRSSGCGKYSLHYHKKCEYIYHVRNPIPERHKSFTDNLSK